MKLPVLKCHAIKRDKTVCGHKWVPRKEKTKICPKCKSPHWQNGS